MLGSQVLDEGQRGLEVGRVDENRPRLRVGQRIGERVEPLRRR